MKRTSLSILDDLITHIHDSLPQVTNTPEIQIKRNRTQQLIRLTYHTFLIYTDSPDKFTLHTSIYTEPACGWQITDQLKIRCCVCRCV